jgi:hypothetical protein
MIKGYEQGEDFFFYKNDSEGQSEIEANLEENIVKIIESLGKEIDDSKSLFLTSELKTPELLVENLSTSLEEDVTQYASNKSKQSSDKNLSLDKIKRKKRDCEKKFHRSALWSEIKIHSREAKSLDKCSIRIPKLATTICNELFQVVSLDKFGNIGKTVIKKKQGQLFTIEKTRNSLDLIKKQKPTSKMKNITPSLKRKKTLMNSPNGKNAEILKSKHLKTGHENKLKSNLTLAYIKPILKNSSQSVKKHKKVSFCSKIFIRRFEAEIYES